MPGGEVGLAGQQMSDVVPPRLSKNLSDIAAVTAATSGSELLCGLV